MNCARLVVFHSLLCSDSWAEINRLWPQNSWVRVSRTQVNHCPQPKLCHQNSFCSPLIFARAQGLSQVDGSQAPPSSNSISALGPQIGHGTNNIGSPANVRLRWKLFHRSMPRYRIAATQREQRLSAFCHEQCYGQKACPKRVWI